MRQKGIGSKIPLAPKGGIYFVAVIFNIIFLRQKSQIVHSCS